MHIYKKKRKILERLFLLKGTERDSSHNNKSIKYDTVTNHMAILEDFFY